ncbi:MAG: hypothetical protein ACJAZJ_001598, partial [Candidatus Endobugula sp.]
MFFSTRGFLKIITAGLIAFTAAHVSAQPSPPVNAVTSSNFHVFGHSLFTYGGGDEATPTVYTNAGNWLGLLASASGNQSVGSFTFGQISGHNAQDWSEANNVVVNGAYDLGNTSVHGEDFANKDFTHFYLMPSNYFEFEMGGPPYTNSVTTTQAGLETLVDNIDNYYASAEKILYVHWPDGGFYINPYIGETLDVLDNRSRFTEYNEDVINEYLSWHVSLQNAINANGRTIRTIPVGPVIAWLLENEPYLQSLNFTDVYGDSAPHGTENIYLLAALVAYHAIYQTPPDLANFTIPSDATQIRSEVANNLPSIIAAIEARLNFHNANGVRVWSDRIASQAPIAVDDIDPSTTRSGDGYIIQVADLIANDTDVDSEVLTIAAVANGSNGVANLIDDLVYFTPSVGFSGTASFEYTAFDGVAASAAAATVSFTVPEEPVIPPVDGAVPILTIVFPASGTVFISGDEVEFIGTAQDEEDGELNYKINWTLASGTVLGSGAYIPVYNLPVGEHIVTAAVVDNDGHVVAQTVTIIIEAPAGSNTAPIAVDDNDPSTTRSADTYIIQTADLITNDIDAENDTLTISAVTNGTNVSVELIGQEVHATPLASFVGIVSFDYTVSDGQATSTATVSFAVTEEPVSNTPPVAVPDTFYTSINESIVIPFSSLTANDV